jgi:hypothetical protein
VDAPRSASPAAFTFRQLTTVAAAMAAAVAAWEVALYPVLTGGRRLSAAAAAVLALDAATALPVAVAALLLARLATRPLGLDATSGARALAVAAFSGAAFALLLIPAVALREARLVGAAALATEVDALGAAGGLDGGFLCAAAAAGGGRPAGAAALLAASARTALILQPPVPLVAAAGLALLGRRGRGLRSVPRPAWITAAAAALAVGACNVMPRLDAGSRAPKVAGPGGGPGAASDGAATGAASACPAGTPVRSYDVSAIHVDMTLNRFGDHDPFAFMYVLDRDVPAVRAQERAPLPDRVSIGLRKDAIQPLVIRANLGDCLRIRFTNRLTTGPAAFHVDGLPYSAESAGGDVGVNPDTFADPGETRVYTFRIPSDPAAERAYYAHDHGDSRQRIVHGLFGVVAVEPQGSTYFDVGTGAPFEGSSWEAMVQPAAGPAFREFVLVYHEVGDETFNPLDVNDRPLPTFDEVSHIYRPAGRALNYRSEPFRNRFLAARADEANSYNSYFFGDQPTPMPRSYLGEPTKMRIVHGGSEVFHVHHLHGGADRWPRQPKVGPSLIARGLDKAPPEQTESIRLDAQAIGPGTAFNAEIECGAGACQQVAGDFLFHCHIQHHYHAGMWSFWRVFDTLHDASVLNDPVIGLAARIGSPEHKEDFPLAPLPDRAPPPRPVPGNLVPAALAAQDPPQDQLPPPGVPFNEDDATVWNWQPGSVPLREPEDVHTWANFHSPAPGQRLPILFNPVNGRYAWPLFRPHLGQRPPFTGRGHTGAPWLGEFATAARPDGLCPTREIVPGADRLTRTFAISAIGPISIPVTRKTVDDAGFLFVLNEERPQVEADPSRRVPLVIRSNTRDCEDVVFVNDVSDDHPLLFGKSATQLHTHFVQFDVQGSDGINTGLSYTEDVNNFRDSQRVLVAPAAAGQNTVRVSNTTLLRPNIWIGVGLGEGLCAVGQPLSVPNPPPPDAPPNDVTPCTEVHRIAAIRGDTLVFDRPLRFAHRAGEFVDVEFVRYKWYSDVQAGTVFFHDHSFLGSWPHGGYASHIIEPRGSTYHDPRTGTPIRSGTIADIHTTASSTLGIDLLGSFREFYAAISSDRQPGLGQQGTFASATINLRATPFFEQPVQEPGLLFSSFVNGDPVTPLVRAYLGDNIVVRTLAEPERIGTLRITGHRFRTEPSLPGAQVVDDITFGVSERFDFVLEGGAGGPGRFAGDYLYYSGIERHFVDGVWGLLRVHDRLQPDLQPLPDHPAPEPNRGLPPPASPPFTPQPTGEPPPAPGPGNSCPPAAPVRHYEVALQDAKIVFNDEDALDAPRPRKPLALDGVTYTLATLPRGSEVRQPLVLRVNQGECLEVALENRLSERAGWSGGEMLFDPQGSYGAAIGFNFDSSTPPGGRRLYRFFADHDVALTLVLDLSNPQLAKQGALAGAIVEPPGSTWSDPRTGDPIATGPLATVVAPTGSFREFAALIQDEDQHIGENIMPYPKFVEPFAGISFSAEKFAQPIEEPDLLLGKLDVDQFRFIFDSKRHGDPRWVVEAEQGDPVVFRVSQPWGQQPHVFGVEGHRWRWEPLEPDAEQIFSFEIAPGVAWDAPLVDGAGGGIPLTRTTDYLFQDHRMPFLQEGLWGILRVHPQGSGAVTPLPRPLAATAPAPR